MGYLILTDDDVRRALDMPTAIRQIETALAEKHIGTLLAPPRFGLQTDRGGLVFSAGAATGTERVMGFRVYDTFPHPTADNDQITAVYNIETGELRGLVVGASLGAIRTGAMGGVAIKWLSRPDARSVGLIGVGVYAQAQLEAALAVRPVEQVRVYSRTPERRAAFADDMSRELDIEVRPVDDVRDAVEGADILISATTSPLPVFDNRWVLPGTHINTVGPRLQGRHEIDPEVARYCRVIATDSLTQVQAYGDSFFLANTEYGKRMVELSDVIAGSARGRETEGDISLFVAVGLAGTEVVVANAAIDALLSG